MIKGLYEVPAFSHWQPPIYAPRPTLPPASYREILEGDWGRLYDCGSKYETKQKHDYSASVILETNFSALRIDSPRIERPDQEQQAASLTLLEHSDSGWLLPVRKERRHGHKASSSLSSLSSISSLDTILSFPQLDVAEDDAVECGDLRSHLHVAEILEWSDEVLQGDSEAKQRPPTPATLPPDTAPTHSEWEKPAVSRLTMWSTKTVDSGCLSAHDIFIS
ncbi:hypothetical protein B0H21DRAFT_712677 [Amylocystis lapponica]|nr:hypothetical protein B0H21DRAFT_712677 [Amylocystis lapponica]